MIRTRLKLFSLFGIPVQIDPSWFVFAVLIVWSLSLGYFPSALPGLSLLFYIAMGVAGAVGLFLSIALHELCHALVARIYGLQIKSITLFLLGGVAEMESEPPSPKVEALMAAAGPAFSLALSLTLLGLNWILTTFLQWNALTLVLTYLTTLNLILALFNLLPAFPLDGGRVFRALLWQRSGNLQQATRRAAKVGRAFGWGFFILAGLTLLRGSFVGAAWWIILGLFLRSAAQTAYQNVVTQSLLAGEPVSHLMHSPVISVAPSVSLQDFVQQYVYRFHYRMFPVVEGARLLGYVDVRQLRELPRDQWPTLKVKDILQPCAPQDIIASDADANTAMSRMQESGTNKLLVVEQSQLKGIVTLQDVLSFLSIKLDVEGGEKPFRPA